MSVVVGFSFPEEAILISDSRISFVKDQVIVGSKDNLQKIFPLTSSLAIGFTSNNVKASYQIIKKIEQYIKNKARRTYTYPLLQDLLRVAAHEYQQIFKGTEKSAMEFVYVGLLNDRMLSLPEAYVMDLVHETGGGAVPEPIGRALMTLHDGILNIPPPTPIVLKQNFPSEEVSPMTIWGFLASGSGKPIEELFKKEYAKLVWTTSDIDMKSNMIRLNCDEFIKKSGIASIGGGVQVLRINPKGVKPVSLSLGRIDNQSNITKLQSMYFDGKDWVYTNFETGKSEIITAELFSIDRQLSLLRN